MAVIFVGLLDMAYAFCLFWPANVIPIFVLTCCMQFFIPLNTILGSLLCGRPQYKKHVWIALYIVAGIMLSFSGYMSSIKNDADFADRAYYLSIFLLGQLVQVLSHQTKESIVRHMPLN